jgi:hypothetical protein
MLLYHIPVVCIRTEQLQRTRKPVYNELMNKQSGFTRTQVIAVIVAAFIIGFGGWFLLHAKQVTNDNTNTQVTTDQYKNAPPGKEAQVAVDNQSSTPASKAVTDFYKKYVNATSGKSDIVSQYGTTNLVNYYQATTTGNDAFTCIQTTPSTITVESQSAGASDESLTVTVISDDVGALPIAVKAVVQGSGWKVDSVTCP